MHLLKSHKSFEGYTEFYEHDSKLTNSKMKFSLYTPPAGSKISGGLIWLSGLTCTEENFIMKAGAQKYLSRLGLVILCPDTSPRGLNLPREHESYDFGSGASLYVDATTEFYRDHYNMYSYINDEIYDLLNEKFNLNGKISVMGHSMGGHGALVLGLRNPKKYKSISAFAPLVNPMVGGWTQKALKGYLGEDIKSWENYDAVELISRGFGHSEVILLDQGLSDEFYPHSLRTSNFVEICKLKNQKLKVNYRDGYDHSYYFVSTFIESHLQYHHEILNKSLFA